LPKWRLDKQSPLAQSVPQDHLMPFNSSGLYPVFEIQPPGITFIADVDRGLAFKIPGSALPKL